jgi:Flp pilus assembly pilin Flp
MIKRKGRNMKLKNIKSRNMESKLKNFNEFILEEEGMGTVEIILIIVVLIGLVIIFKNQLRALVTKVFKKITEDSNTVMS